MKNYHTSLYLNWTYDLGYKSKTIIENLVRKMLLHYNIHTLKDNLDSK